MGSGTEEEKKGVKEIGFAVDGSVLVNLSMLPSMLPNPLVPPFPVFRGGLDESYSRTYSSS